MQNINKIIEANAAYDSLTRLCALMSEIETLLYCEEVVLPLTFGVKGAIEKDANKQVAITREQNKNSLEYFENLRSKIFSHFNYPNYDIKTNTFNSYKKLSK